MEDWQKTAQGKKTVHQIEKCKCCLLTTPVQSSLFKKRTGCVVSRREASTEVKSWAKELSGKKIFTPTQKEVKNIGSVIYKEFDSVCKEQLGKSFEEVMSMVPCGNARYLVRVKAIICCSFFRWLSRKAYKLSTTYKIQSTCTADGKCIPIVLT